MKDITILIPVHALNEKFDGYFTNAINSIQTQKDITLRIL